MRFRASTEIITGEFQISYEGLYFTEARVSAVTDPVLLTVRPLGVPGPIHLAAGSILQLVIGEPHGAGLDVKH